MLKKSIRLSVIVTVYNREKYIHRCLDSLLEQSVPEREYEILVIDDGSTDDSGKILDEYADQYKNIRVIHKENKGVADARNCGLENAKGIYVTYVDSDDFVEKDCYEELLKDAEQKDCDILVCDYYEVHAKEKKYIEIFPKLKEGRMSTREYILSTPSPCNKLMKRDLFIKGKIRFPFGIYYEDYATIPLLANEAQNIFYVKKAYLNYFQDNTSITRNTGYQEKWWDMYKATENLNKLKSVYREELEYMVYLYLLIRTSSWYLQTGRLKEVERIADYYRKHFPSWKKNKYIKQREKKERIIAFLIYKKWGKVILCFTSLKKRMKLNVKKNQD